MPLAVARALVRQARRECGKKPLAAQVDDSATHEHRKARCHQQKRIEAALVLHIEASKDLVPKQFAPHRTLVDQVDRERCGGERVYELALGNVKPPEKLKKTDAR